MYLTHFSNANQRSFSLKNYIIIETNNNKISLLHLNHWFSKKPFDFLTLFKIEENMLAKTPNKAELLFPKLQLNILFE